MAETAKVEMSDNERRAQDRCMATMAARLMWCCLDIEAEPTFDVTNSNVTDTPNVKLEPYGIGLFKDALDFSIDGEKVELQLLITDENGMARAESKRLFPLGHGMDLLARLPLSLSPRANKWLKDVLRETGPAEGRVLQGSAVPAGIQIQKGIKKQC